MWQACDEACLFPCLYGVWNIVASAVSLSLGMATGGWRIAHKIGFSVVRLRPMSALAAQLAAMGVVLTGVQIGAPLGTTQILTSSTLGAGTVRSLSRWRWGIVRQVLVAWIITLPSAALPFPSKCEMIEAQGG